MCSCTTEHRCTLAHAIRDAYQAAPSIEARIAQAQRYTQHLYEARLLAYPTTASPTWHCDVACAPEAACRAGTP